MRFKFTKSWFNKAVKLEAGCNVSAGLPSRPAIKAQLETTRVHRKSEVTMTKGQLLKLVGFAYGLGLNEAVKAQQGKTVCRLFEENVALQRALKDLELI